MKKKWLIALLAAATAAAAILVPPLAPIIGAVGEVVLGLPGDPLPVEPLLPAKSGL